jgi:hypothetical protein
MKHLTDTGNMPTYNDTDVIAGQVYYYRVSAVNSLGEGEASNEGRSSSIAAPRTPVEETDEKDSGIPGFPVNALLLAIILMVYIRKK